MASLFKRLMGLGGSRDKREDDAQPGSASDHQIPQLPWTGFVDIHGHYLPGIDDGAKDLDMSLEMLRDAVDQGISRLIMTPHYWPGVFDQERAKVRAVFDQLREAVRAEKIPVKLALAGEVRLCDENMKAIDSRKIPFIGRWNMRPALLLELPDGWIPPGTLEYCEQIVRNGLQPVIAHPERIKTVMTDPEQIEPFVRAGCLLQLTAASLVGRFGSGAERASWAILESGWASFVASDAHNLRSRPPCNGDAADLVAHRFGEDMAWKLFRDNPQRLLDEASAMRKRQRELAASGSDRIKAAA